MAHTNTNSITQHEIERDDGPEQESDDGQDSSPDNGENDEDHNEDDYDEDDDEDGDSGYAESDDVPPYSIAEITNKILGFYKFLTTVHFDESDLRIPPPEGWPHTPDPDGEDPVTNKSHLVRSVLKHLPFFVDSTRAQIHYKSHVIDFSDYEAESKSIIGWNQYFEDASISTWDDPPTHPADILVIALGFESGSRNIVLVPKKGQIFTEFGGGCGSSDAEDIMHFFDKLKTDYEKLNLLFAPGKEIIETPSQYEEFDSTPPFGYCPEAEHEIKYEDVLANIESHDSFRNDLTVQYLRQVFRKHGWPKEYDRDAIMVEIEQLDEAYRKKDKMGWSEDNRY